MQQPSITYSQVQRFWRLEGTDERLDSSGFFVPPFRVISRPEADDARQSGIYSLSQWAHQPCLILLGEPGMGKSTDLIEVMSSERDKDNAILHIDLNAFSQESTLLSYIFQSEEFEAWRSGQVKLQVWLDSLDECLWRIESFGSLLGQEIKRQLSNEKIEPFVLRIACRSTVWPNSLTASLQKVYGEENVSTLHLCPLQRSDVETFARAEGVEPHAFLSEVERQAVTTLATIPISLKFLLRSFKNGETAATRDVLYEQGCLHLCEESNESRLEKRSIGTLSPAKRLEIASRIATISVFSGKSLIWIGRMGETPEGALNIADIQGKTNTEFLNATVSRQEIDEVLDTALFRRHRFGGVSFVTFAHRTYAEFLAAYHLNSLQIPTSQIVNLLNHSTPIGDKSAIVPQLLETATWLVLFELKSGGKDKGIFRYLINVYPTALLRSDIAFASDLQIAQLVRILLEEIREGYLAYRQYSNDYQYLNIPNLVEQIKPYLTDRSKDTIARCTAIRITQECSQTFSLADVLVNLALDESEDLEIRTSAAHAVLVIGKATDNQDLLLRLRPLVFEQLEVDEHEGLKGIALRALWPSCMSSEELFSILQPPKSEVFGMYHGFIASILNYLEVQDLPIALKWCATPDLFLGNSLKIDPFVDLVGSILELACKHIDVPYVAETLARALAVRFQEQNLGHIQQYPYVSLHSEHFIEFLPEENRRLVVSNLVSLVLLENDNLILGSLFYRFGRYSAWVLPQDFNWLIKQVSDAKDENVVGNWSYLIQELCYRSEVLLEPDNVAELFAVQEKIPALKQALSYWFEIIQLDSQRAMKLKENHLRRRKQQEEQNKLHETLEFEQQSNEKKCSLEIEKGLAASEAGKYLAWWEIEYYVMDGINGNGYHNHINQTEFWTKANKSKRQRLLRAAESYLANYKPSQDILDQWARGTFDRCALAAHRALLLLFIEDDTAFDALPQSQRKVWAKAMIWFPWAGGEPWEKDNHSLLRAFHEKFPEDVTEAILARIEYIDENDDYFFVLRKLEFVWSNTLKDALLEKLSDDRLRPAQVYQLLKSLLQCEHFSAVSDHIANTHAPGQFRARIVSQKAEAMLLRDLSSNPRNEERANFIARALLDYAIDGGWPILWDLLRENREWGKKVMLDYVRGYLRPYKSQFLTHLSEKSMANWYLWLIQVFPREEDLRVNGHHSFSPREQLSNFRDSLLERLSERGTLEAVRRLEHIAKKVEKKDFAQGMILIIARAKELALANTWSPPAPVDIVALLNSPHKRFVSNGDELLNVLIESLQRLEEDFQGETPSAPFVWNTLPGNKSQPKDENAFSDWIKRHLEKDIIGKGIVVNREVEIRRGEGDGRGERTDIQVNAILPTYTNRGEEVKITVIIEVKCAWHQELETAMETQLRDRYLKDNVCRHGLYVIGWFNCSQWDTSDGRYKKAPKMALEDAQKRFDEQAKALSCNGISLRAMVLDAKLR